MSALSVRTWITFFLLSVILGLNNIYSTLLTGWGDTGAIISVVLCLILLGRRETNINTLNLGQTMASGGGAVGFTTAVLASSYVLTPGWQPNLTAMVFLIMSVSLLGVIISIPLRSTLRKWYFPSAVACATVLKAVTAETDHLRARAKKVMGFAGGISALLTFPTKVAFTKGGHALWDKISLPSVLGISLDPLLYGIGMVVGPRIGVSMLLAGLFLTFWFKPHLISLGIENIGDHIKWAAVGLMSLPAFSSLGFALWFRTERKLPPGFSPREDTPSDRLTSQQRIVLAVLGFVCTVVACVLLNSEFGIHWGFVLGGIILAFPLVVMLGKVASETDINPVRLVAIVLLGLISLISQMGASQLLAVGIFCGAAFASIAVDLFYDLRTGYLIGANPKPQLAVQFLGVVAASLVTAPFLHMLATDFGFGEGKYFPAPAAHVWAGMAEGFAKGTGALTGALLTTFLWMSAVGVVLSFFEVWPRTRKFAVSPAAMGIGLLLPIEMGPAFAIGGLLAWALKYPASKALRMAKTEADRAGAQSHLEQVESDIMQGGSAVFAAAALTGIAAVLLITLGVVYLPG